MGWVALSKKYPAKHFFPFTNIKYNVCFYYTLLCYNLDSHKTETEKKKKKKKYSDETSCRHNISKIL